MDDHVLRMITDAVRSGHAEAMAEGAVLSPRLFAFCGGDLIGYVALRPVYCGADAAEAVALMSHLAAAARADAVVATWEGQDLAAACGHAPLHPGATLNLVRATAGGHVLYRYPYDEQLLAGRTDDGALRVRPDWLPEPAPAPGAELEPAIAALLAFCWQPLELPSCQPVEASADYLTAQGYTVRLTVPRS